MTNSYFYVDELQLVDQMNTYDIYMKQLLRLIIIPR
jgi:hypothetical protein